MHRQLEHLRVSLFESVNIMPLVLFRVLFGGIMMWEVFRYFSKGWIERYYMAPSFHFTYYGFDWISPLPGEGMVWVFYALGVICLLIVIGLMYRLAMTAFFLVFTYIFLLDQTQYLNHFYLISLLGFLLIFLPLHRAYSVDAWLEPKLRSATAPRWTLYWLRFQVGVPYVYGAFAKMNGDWLRGEPMRDWLAARTDFPLVGQYFTTEWAPYFFSYGGLFLDLLAVPLVLWRRTRWLGVAGIAFFHIMNANLFPIGIFPWMMLGATLIFMPPEWFNIFVKRMGNQPQEQQQSFSLNRQYTVLGLIGVYVAWQLLFPFRHVLYPGKVSWTEEGHRFAWHMRLRDKDAFVRLFVEDAQGNSAEINVLDYLTTRQRNKMASRPDMLLQFAHHVEADMRQKGHEGVVVRAWVMASLNSRPPQLFVDPTMDLTQHHRGIHPNAFVLPLEQSFGHMPDPLVAIGYDGDRLMFINSGYSSVSLHSLELIGGNDPILTDGLHRQTLAGGTCLIVDTTQRISYNSGQCDPAYLPLTPELTSTLTVHINGAVVHECPPISGLCLVALPRSET
ncbi:MAG: HTTM domain-containing protein [Chloroflexota bacterium]